jgi:hypothetical protein
MEFEVDVSGEDILNPHYTICIANKDGLIKGFKMTEAIINILSSRYGQKLYRYSTSNSGKVRLKIRIYCVIIYHLFRSIKPRNINLRLCKDFDGKDQEIRDNLDYFLKDLLKIQIGTYMFEKLDKDSNAHKYAYLMRKDNKNKLGTYVDISAEEIDTFLRK